MVRCSFFAKNVLVTAIQRCLKFSFTPGHYYVMTLWVFGFEAIGVTGIFFAILGRGPRAFQIGKISAVNHYFGKFLVSLKTKLAITHTFAIKLKENRMQF